MSVRTFVSTQTNTLFCNTYISLEKIMEFAVVLSFKRYTNIPIGLYRRTEIIYNMIQPNHRLVLCNFNYLLTGSLNVKNL